MPFPFTHQNGNICCSTRKGCCPNCEAKLTAENTGRTLRSAADYAPPDPYKAGIDAQRASDAKVAAEKTYQPTPRSTTPVLDANGVPDPYAAALDAMRREGR